MDHINEVTHIESVRLSDDGTCVVIIDQTQLPNRTEYLELSSAEDIWDAIYTLKVRGAPAIGGVAAYGVWFAAHDRKNFDQKCDYLKNARPTAVNLAWAVDRVRTVALQSEFDLNEVRKAADTIVAEDIAMNRKMGLIGSEVIRPGATILTHCNTGALATCGWGTVH